MISRNKREGKFVGKYSRRFVRFKAEKWPFKRVGFSGKVSTNLAWLILHERHSR